MSLFDRAARFIDDVLLLPEELREQLDAAEASLEAGDFSAAERGFAEVLDGRPTLVRARQGLAHVLHRRRRFSEAKEILRVSRMLDPSDTEVALLSAQVALSAGELDLAIEEAKEVARRTVRAGGEPFKAASVIQARAEARRGRSDRAARELRKALAVDPADTRLRFELAEALALCGRGASAAAALRGLDIERIDSDRAYRLGVAMLRVGERERARVLLVNAARGGKAEASEALARVSLGESDVAEAETHARTAVARGGGPPALATLADVLLKAGRPGEAAQALMTASRGTASGEEPANRELLLRAARTMPLEDPRELDRLSDRLSALAVDAPATRAVRAWALLLAGRHEAVSPLLEPLAGEPRLALAKAKLALERGRPADALAVLASDWVFADPDRALCRRLRRDALRAMWRGPGDEIDLAAAIDEVARFAKERGLSDLERRARVLRDDLDRPLVLAILGEFNAGKSTLVNAFVGADVAPTGIVPTTATLNLIRGGAERLVRVVRHDGTTREGDFGQLRALLEKSEDGRAEPEVDRVEIVLPSELLERVWVLDTPGSNAPVAEHERLAKEAMHRADAALWVFDAGQAGKATEARNLNAVRASRRQVLAVINKVDRLAAGQVERVRGVLQHDLPNLERPIIAVSAKQALKARLSADRAALVSSGFAALMDRLERMIFSRSRVLKRRASGGRLLLLLVDVLETERTAIASYEAKARALEALEAPLAAAAEGLARAVDGAVLELSEGQRAAFRAAADEVIAFVRPRTHRFASHGADFEDRAFLADVIGEKLERAATACEQSLRSRVFSVTQKVGEPVLGRAGLEQRAKQAVEPAIAAFVGYQKGLLEGGTLLRFFEETLPRAELSVAPLAEALESAKAHPGQALRPRLHEAMDRLLDELERARSQALTEVRNEQRMLQERTYEPLRALSDVLEELVPKPEAASAAAHSMSPT